MVEVIAGDAGEDEVVRAGEVPPPAEVSQEAAATGSIIGTVRPVRFFGVSSWRCVEPARTRTACSSKSTSRQRRASSSPMRRPVNAAV